MDIDILDLKKCKIVKKETKKEDDSEPERKRKKLEENVRGLYMKKTNSEKQM